VRNLRLNDLVDGNVRNVSVDRVGRPGWSSSPIALGRFFNIPDLEVHSGSGGQGRQRGRSRPDRHPAPAGCSCSPARWPVTARCAVRRSKGQRGRPIWCSTSEHNQVRIIATRPLPRGFRGPMPCRPRFIPDADQPAVLEQFTRTIDTKEIGRSVSDLPKPSHGAAGSWWRAAGQNMTIDLDRLQRP